MTGYRHDAGLPRVSEVPVRPIRPLQAPPIGFQQPDDFSDLEGHTKTVTMSYDISPCGIDSGDPDPTAPTVIKRSRMYREKR
jgi:hypothetical protein